MRNIDIVKRFNLNEHMPNETSTITYVVKDDNLFIHGFESKSGKSLNSFASVINVVVENEQLEQVNITSKVEKHHSNKLSIASLFPNNSIQETLKIIVSCADLHTKKCTSIIIGTK